MISWASGFDRKALISKGWDAGKPLFVKNAVSWKDSDFQPIDFEQLAKEPDLFPERIVRKEGQLSKQAGPFEAIDWARSTLLLYQMDQFEPFERLQSLFHEFFPAWFFDDVMVSVSHEGGGVGAHLDLYDVFLLQLSGEKRWRITEELDSKEIGFSNHEPMEIESFDSLVSQSFVAEKGDLLYLPPNFGHEGIALSSNCQTASIGLRLPVPSDVLSQLAVTLSGQSLRIPSACFNESEEDCIRSALIGMMQHLGFKQWKETLHELEKDAFGD